jgi:hypothetical protein
MKQSNQQNWAATNLFLISYEELARIGLCTMKIKATSIILSDQTDHLWISFMICKLNLEAMILFL